MPPLGCALRFFHFSIFKARLASGSLVGRAMWKCSQLRNRGLLHLLISTSRVVLYE